MPAPVAVRRRLHPAALAAVILCGFVIVGALGFIAWFLTSPSGNATATPTADPVTAANDEATGRLVHWSELFEKYRAANGSYPEMADGGYCLGTGFPVGTGGTANCRDYQETSYYTEEASVPLMQALATVGELPTGVSAPVRGTVGPYALYEGDKIDLLTAEKWTCSAPAVDVWSDGEGRHICAISLQR